MKMKELICAIIVLLSLSVIPAYAQTATPTPTDFPMPSDTPTPTPTIDIFDDSYLTPTIDPSTFQYIEVASNSALSSSMWAMNDVIWNIGLIVAFSLGVLIGVFPFSFL